VAAVRPVDGRIVMISFRTDFDRLVVVRLVSLLVVMRLGLVRRGGMRSIGLGLVRLGGMRSIGLGLPALARLRAAREDDGAAWTHGGRRFRRLRRRGWHRGGSRSKRTDRGWRAHRRPAGNDRDGQRRFDRR
jgi:hypothetical protein